MEDDFVVSFEDGVKMLESLDRPPKINKRLRDALLSITNNIKRK